MTELVGTDYLTHSVVYATCQTLPFISTTILEALSERRKGAVFSLDVPCLRQCFREFSLEAYPALVALVWPEYQRPQVNG